MKSFKLRNNQTGLFEMVPEVISLLNNVFPNDYIYITFDILLCVKTTEG